MKIIRLTSESESATFNSFFNEDIRIKAESKIALCNASLESKSKTIIINGDNDNISFQLVPADASGFGGTHEITLLHTGVNNYNSNNYQVLLDDIKLKMNRAIGARRGAEIGVQFDLQVGNDGKLNILGTQSDSSSRNVNLIQNIRRHAGAGGNFTIDYTASVDPSWNRKVGDPASNTNEAFTYYTHHLTKGAGIFRTKIRRLNNGDADESKCGWIMGLTDINIPVKLDNDGMLLDSDIKYGIAVGRTDTSYRKIEDGHFTNAVGLPNYTGNNSGTNDIMELCIEFGSIKGRIYREGQPDPIEAFSHPYDGTTNYFPFLIFRGDSNDRLRFVRITSDPYIDPPTLKIGNEFIDNEMNDPAGLTAPPAPTINTRATFQMLNFENVSLSNFLGFQNVRQPVAGFNLVRHFLFTADEKFQLTDSADAFLVLLDNIQLKSYDDFDRNGYGKGGRKNILSVIPQSDNNETVIYEPNSFIFVDLDNTNDINIRNIKARILKNDYSSITTSGLSTLTLLIKDKNE